jgi:hypothetical protein
MEESEIMNLIKDNVRITVKDFNGVPHKARINFIRVFNLTHSLYVGGWSYVDAYPYDSGSGIHLFQINTKTGEFRTVVDLCSQLELLEDIKIINSQCNYNQSFEQREEKSGACL